MTSIPTFALRGFRENQYGAHLGTTSQQVTKLSLTRTLKVNKKKGRVGGEFELSG